MEDFVGVYDNVLSKEDCKFIIDWFESSTDLHEIGKSAAGINREVKDSTDIACVMSSNIPVSNLIHGALQSCFKKYVGSFKILDHLAMFALNPGYNLQRYYPNQGYFNEHCENVGGHGIDSKRVLAWTIYLNDVTDGGYTEFPSQGKKYQPRTGNFLIWPAFFTHPHRGIVSKTQTKYIATSWISVTNKLCTK